MMVLFKILWMWAAHPFRYANIVRNFDDDTLRGWIGEEASDEEIQAGHVLLNIVADVIIFSRAIVLGIIGALMISYTIVYGGLI